MNFLYRYENVIVSTTMFIATSLFFTLMLLLDCTFLETAIGTGLASDYAVFVLGILVSVAVYREFKLLDQV